MTVDDVDSGTTITRASAAQIRRAAGGKNTLLLSKLVETGWTSAELNAMASEDGKSALHMAAWHGSLDNITYLLNLGCDINQIATGPYSYGKTPIFFAVTRCRDDACMLLLSRGAYVCIVNNKGQSVLSLASSHLQQETITAIQEAELKQMKWTNYRATHSDGADYGDLDPRFVSIRPSDVVTELAINPTTKQSRRGNFARMNPEIARETKHNPSRKQQKKASPPEPTEAELAELERAWKQVGIALSSHDTSLFFDSLVFIIQYAERQRRAWIPDTAKRLRHCAENTDRIEHMMTEVFGDVSNLHNARDFVLLKKLLQVAINGDNHQLPISVQKSETTSELSQEPLWRLASNAVRGLSQTTLQNSDRDQKYLSLSKHPTWIDSLDQLSAFETILFDLNPTLVAIDTEWYTAEEENVRVATLQIAFVTESMIPNAWVIDLKPHCNNDSCNCQRYQSKASKMIRWLFDDSGLIILGFAIGHDIPKLKSFCKTDKLSTTHCLDIQPLLAAKINNGTRNQSSMPSLKACCNQYLASGERWELSKEQQCSDWGRRPLSAAQMEYAGLDAAVLLVLLAELDSS